MSSENDHVLGLKENHSRNPKVNELIKYYTYFGFLAIDLLLFMRKGKYTEKLDRA